MPLLVVQSSWPERILSISGTLTTLNTHARLGLTPSILNPTTVNACVDTRRTNGKKWSFKGSCGLSKRHLILRCQRQNMAGWTVSWPQNISYILTTSSLNLYAASIAHSNLRATLPHFFFRYIYIWFQLSMSPIPWDFKDLSVLEKEKKEDGLLVKILCCDLTASGPEADLLLDLGNSPNLHLMQLLLKFKDNNDILHIQLVISLRCRHSLSTSLTKWGAYLGWKLSTQIFRQKLQPFWN